MTLPVRDKILVEKALKIIAKSLRDEIEFMPDNNNYLMCCK
jgi:hypothetical protein